jgi:hypothetical protein
VKLITNIWFGSYRLMEVCVDAAYTPLWHGSESRKNVQAQRYIVYNDMCVTGELGSL